MVPQFGGPQNKLRPNNLLSLIVYHLKGFQSRDPCYKQVKDELRMVGQEIESTQLSTVWTGGN